MAPEAPLPGNPRAKPGVSRSDTPMAPTRSPAPTQSLHRGRRWLGPAVFAAIVLVAIVVCLGRTGSEPPPTDRTRTTPEPDVEPERPDPVFRGVQSVEFQASGADGLTRRHLANDELERAARCLETTVEVEPEAAERAPLARKTHLVLVGDDHGMRNFELLTDEHLKGNGERYYENRCIQGFVDP